MSTEKKIPRTVFELEWADYAVFWPVNCSFLITAGFINSYAKRTTRCFCRTTQVVRPLNPRLYTYSRVHHELTSELRHTPGVATNLGMELASGDWDVLASNALAVLMWVMVLLFDLYSLVMAVFGSTFGLAWCCGSWASCCA